MLSDVILWAPRVLRGAAFYVQQKVEKDTKIIGNENKIDKSGRYNYNQLLEEGNGFVKEGM